MIIREAIVDDAQAMAKIHVDAWRTTYSGIIPEDYLRELSYEKWTEINKKFLENPFPGVKTFVADLDDTEGVVGAVTAGPERQNHRVYKGELFGIYILQPFQRQGIGHQLVSEAKQHLRQLGLRSMLVWVLADNPHQAFYQRLGGQVVDERWIEIGGASLKELAYGWLDLRKLKT